MAKFIRKRDGKLVEFDYHKIHNAIVGAMQEADRINTKVSLGIAMNIAKDLKEEVVDVETVQDLVENELMKEYPDVAKAYIKYRQERTRIRQMNSDINKHVKEVMACTNIQNSNANLDEYSFIGRKNEATNVIQKELGLNEFVSPEVVAAHKNNELYLHDASDYVSGMSNCLNADLYTLLTKGFATRNGDVRPANSFSTACQLVAVIFQSSSMCQFGGIASSSLDYELAPFVRITFLKKYKDGLKYADRRKNKTWEDFGSMYDENIRNYASVVSKCNIFKVYSNSAYVYALEMLEKEGRQSTQALYHNLNTLESRGAQLPFSSINFGLNTTFEGRKVTEWCLLASIEGIGKNKQTPIFPISIMKHKRDVNDRPGTPNYDLKKLAIKSLCARIYPNWVNCDWSVNKADKLPSQYIITDVNVSPDNKVNIRIGSKEYGCISVESLWELIVKNPINTISEIDIDNKGKQIIDLRFVDKGVYINDKSSKYKDYAISIDEHMAKISYIVKDTVSGWYCITTDSFEFDISVESTDIHYTHPYPIYDYDTEMATMGSCDGIEVITYKLDGVVYVESFERSWERISYFYDHNIKIKGLAEYIDTPGLLIYDSFSKGFTNTKRIIKNKDIGVWNRVKLNGRNLLLTDDHPLPTQRGRVFVKDLRVGDSVAKVNTQYSETSPMFENISNDFAWLLGVIVCDGQYQTSGVVCSFGMDERELAEKTARVMHEVWGLTPHIKEQHRGVKGNYLDVAVYNVKVAKELQQFFEGVNKVDRHIPACVFNGFSYDAKCSFLAGMIDADGYIRDKGYYIDIGSTNPELAIQEALLAQALSFPAKIGINYYKGKEYKDKIRYKVGIHMADEFSTRCVCEKKTLNNRDFIAYRVTHMAKVEDIEKLGFRNRFGYDVETESDHFDVSGINSHNCRTLVGYDVNGMGYKKTGRGNASPITINLVKIGIDNGICLGKREEADIDGFFKQLNKMLKLGEKALLDRFKHICSQNYKSGIFLYDNNNIADAELTVANEDIYYTMRHFSNTLGYIGLAETCYALFGKYHNQDKEVLKFAVSVVKAIYDYVQLHL